MSSLRRKITPNLTSRNNAARPYDRLSQLPKLIGLWPSEMQDYSAAGTLKILALLRKALRSERSRGRSGHWTYDLNRHLALAESLKAERAHLRALDGAPARPERALKRGPSPRPERLLHLPANSRGRPCADQPVFLLPILAESSS